MNPCLYHFCKGYIRENERTSEKDIVIKMDELDADIEITADSGGDLMAKAQDQLFLIQLYMVL